MNGGRRALTWLMAAMPSMVLAQPCSGVVYLTFDTGNMRHAESIAGTLRKHDVKATFFLANEKTTRGDYSLDAAWAGYWKQLAAEGHAFGSHTWRHGRIGPDANDGAIRYRPAFGQDEGRTVTLSSQDFCAELKRPGAAFREYTGRTLDALWRAPGGKATPGALKAAQRCGYAHVQWAPAGFLGDELPSETHSERSAAGPGAAQRARRRRPDGAPRDLVAPRSVRADDRSADRRPEAARLLLQDAARPSRLPRRAAADHARREPFAMSAR